MSEQNTLTSGAPQPVSRRRFLGYAGAIAGAGLLAGSIGCKKEEDPWEGAINLGSGDVGVLNLAYAIEQLQSAFYTQAVVKPYVSINQQELNYLIEIHHHELAHREFFRKLLSAGAIKDITPDFSNVDFTKRTSVLDTARIFKDISISAYNGMAKLLSNDVFLEVTAKISSVEARHAALIRDLIKMGSFADPDAVDSDGLDHVRDPKDVLLLANAYIKDRLNYTNLPTS